MRQSVVRRLRDRPPGRSLQPRERLRNRSVRVSFRKHHKAVLLMTILAVLNGGCIDLITESVKDGVSDAISGAVAAVLASMFPAGEDV